MYSTTGNHVTAPMGRDLKPYLFSEVTNQSAPWQTLLRQWTVSGGLIAAVGGVQLHRSGADGAGQVDCMVERVRER